jgi:hypothetical protein
MRLGLKFWLGIALGGAAMFGTVGPAAADRPGTPNNLTAFDCGIPVSEDNAEAVCGSFKSAADEEVTYESQITENGRPAGPGLEMDCPRKNFVYPSACVVFGTKHDHQPVEFMIRHAKFDTSYCIRFRARRVSDQMVSELWSNQACTHTLPPPPPPAKATISLQYVQETGQLGTVGPPQVKITVDRPPLRTDQQVSFGQTAGAAAVPVSSGTYGQAYSVAKKGDGLWVYDVPRFANGDDAILYIWVCNINPSGKACSTREIDATAQRDIKVDGALPIKRTGGAPGQPPPPHQTSGFDGAWNVTTDQNTAFTLSIMLVNGVKMGGAVDPPNPADKINMYGKLVDPTHAQMNFSMPGHIEFGTTVLTGTLGITLTNGGTAFIAIAQYSNNTTSVWRGTKTTPSPAR